METITANLSFLLSGFQLTLKLAGLAILFSFFLGTFLGVLRNSSRSYLSYPASIYIEVIRGTPLIMVIFWIFFLVPIIFSRPIEAFFSALISLTLFTSAYIAEIIRAGLRSVPQGQIESGRATGLNEAQVMLYIVLPQAVRNMLPALVSQFIALFKDTSLAYIIGVVELTRAATIVNNREYRSFVIFGFVALLYFVCCYGLSLVARMLERRRARQMGGQRFADIIQQLT